MILQAVLLWFALGFVGGVIICAKTSADLHKDPLFRGRFRILFFASVLGIASVLGVFSLVVSLLRNADEL